MATVAGERGAAGYVTAEEAPGVLSRPPAKSHAAQAKVGSSAGGVNRPRDKPSSAGSRPCSKPGGTSTRGRRGPPGSGGRTCSTQASTCAARKFSDASRSGCSKRLADLLGPPPARKPPGVNAQAPTIPQVSPQQRWHFGRRRARRANRGASPCRGDVGSKPSPHCPHEPSLARRGPHRRLGQPFDGLDKGGTASRQKLQSELSQRDGTFFRRVLLSASKRMEPTSVPSEPEPSRAVMTRYLERYGGFGSLKELGLVQWQLAQAMDLASAGMPDAAMDVIALLMIMVEQAALDGGRTDLSFLLTLQPDPPSSIFLNHQALPTSGLRPFAPLADQRLVASTLAYVKELDTLATKRGELAGRQNPRFSLPRRRQTQGPCLESSSEHVHGPRRKLQQMWGPDH